MTADLSKTQLIPYTGATITDHKRLLEDLEKNRLRGYSIDRGELIPNIFSVGAPIFDRNGTIAASISISSDPVMLDLDNFSELTDELILASREISHSLGYITTYII
ncbi:IclR family transcriptional regulator domain-containing protein [Desulforhopalus singaporensis]|uniref:Transcriptional regulator n=1 Tax=Desulforhopalus singaporensis TaxID=91360 RepID=A0A1H0TFQ2_9BACT|nr:transcriptional regulator [Desulforhopalus singaporensis]